MTSKTVQCDFSYGVMTSRLPGAVGIFQLTGDVESVLGQLTRQTNWPVGRLRLVSLADVDEGLAGRMTPRVAQIMPHGGPRVMQQLSERLEELGGRPMNEHEADPLEQYPEAADHYEALALAAIARAASPAAIEPLLQQPAIWRRGGPVTDADRARSGVLNRLIDPPLVVLAGPANVGKSTLSNVLVGRSMSIAIDMPGTTRDYTSARIEFGGLVVQWCDTPGLRFTGDEIEARSIDLARSLMQQADLLIAMTDAKHDWPTLPCEAELRIAGKADQAARDDADLAVSAVTGEGITTLVQRVRDALVPAEAIQAAAERPWIFDQRLERDLG